MLSDPVSAPDHRPVAASRKVAILGMGSIGASIVELWNSAPPAGHALVAVCGRPTQADMLGAQLPDSTAFTTTVAAMIDHAPDIVIEAAGHSAVTESGCQILSAGIDLHLLSAGVLANPDLARDLVAAAKTGGSAIIIPAGAMAGFDGLRALDVDGGARVTYISTKPPVAWVGTPADAAFDLPNITSRTVLFDGNAADAARLYPKNANLAAAIALAGVGFEQTRVVLVADPSITSNLGEIKAENERTSLFVRVAGEASAINPKTSMIVGASAIASLCNRTDTIRFC